VLLLLWNRGTAPIEKSDFVEPIKVLPTSSILHVEAHEQNSAAAATVVNEEISIELLRPNEAIIFSIDAIEPDFTPEISIVMKSADMSEFLRSAPVNIRNVIPIVAAIATFLLVAGIFIWSAVSFDLRSVLSTDVLAWGTVLLAFGLAYLVHKFVRRSLLWGTFHLPAIFPNAKDVRRDQPFLEVVAEGKPRFDGDGVINATSVTTPSRASPSSLQKIRLSSDGDNPLNGSRNWWADGDGWPVCT